MTNPLEPTDSTQVCDEQVWVLQLRMMGDGLYLVDDTATGEVSLRDHATLLSLLRQRLGETP